MDGVSSRADRHGEASSPRPTPSACAEGAVPTQEATVACRRVHTVVAGPDERISKRWQCIVLRITMQSPSSWRAASRHGLQRFGAEDRGALVVMSLFLVKVWAVAPNSSYTRPPGDMIVPLSLAHCQPNTISEQTVSCELKATCQTRACEVVSAESECVRQVVREANRGFELKREYSGAVRQASEEVHAGPAFLPLR